MRVLLEYFLDCRRHCRPHRRRIRVWFGIGPTNILLRPNEESFIMSNLRLDQTNALSIEAVDANGTAVPSVFDSPPVWTNSNDTKATVAAAADGLTAVVTPVSLGETTVTVSASIGGASFSATLVITVVAGLVVGIRIVENITPA